MLFNLSGIFGNWLYLRRAVTGYVARVARLPILSPERLCERPHHLASLRISHYMTPEQQRQPLLQGLQRLQASPSSHWGRLCERLLPDKT